MYNGNISLFVGECMKRNFKFFVICLIAVLVLASCASTEKIVEEQLPGGLYINGHLVTFELDGGEMLDGELEKAIMNAGEAAVVTLPEAGKDGYTFLGWTLEGSEPMTSIVAETVTAPITLKASWEIIYYPITYKNAFVSGSGRDSNDIPALTGLPVTYTVEDAGTALPQPEIEGYFFMGWLEEGDSEKNLKKDYVLEPGTTGAKTAVAYWDTEYNINYDKYGLVANDPEPVEEIPVIEEKVEEEDPFPATYVSEKGAEIGTPERKGFEFVGWAEKKSEDDDLKANAKADYTIKVGERGDKDLVAVWNRLSYSITYTLHNGTLAETNPSSYVFDCDPVALSSPEREYYEFAGWMDEETGKLYLDEFTDTDLGRDVKLTAVWTPDSYPIIYDLGGGSFEEDVPQSYTYETATFTIPAPVRDGYAFTGWTTEEEVAVDPVLFTLTFTIQNVDIEVRIYSTYSEFVLPLGLDDSTVEKIAEYLEREFPEAETKVNAHIVKLDYSFADPSLIEGIIRNFALDAGFIYGDYESTETADVEYSEITIPQGSVGEKKYTAHWSILTYTLSYGEEEEYAPRIEEVVPENPTTYTAEDIVTIQNPEKFGYDFMGWVLEDEEYTEAKRDLVLEEGTTGDRVYIPLFRLHNYSVSLNLDGGRISVPLTFTIEDENFEIGEPEKDGYTFIGWLGEDGSVKKTVTVECAKGEDCVLAALWETVDYTITYDLNGGRMEKGSGENLTYYTVESAPFTLINPVRDRYEFAGWVLDENDLPETEYTFNPSVAADCTLTAQWVEKEYSIVYDLDGGSFEYADSNPVSFTAFSANLILAAPTKDGYTFVGWVEEGKEDCRPQVSYVIRSASVSSDVHLKALWKESTYSITYNLNGGHYERGTESNRTSYSLGDEAFVLSSPVRDGYTFLGWVKGDTDLPVVGLAVDTSVGANLSFEALWSADEYTITYVLDGGEYLYGNSNPETYTVESVITLASPHKDGYTFLGWVRSGDPTESVTQNARIAKGTSGDLTFYAKYEQTLVATGEATRLQKEIRVIGRDGIARPDWVISVPSSSAYYYAKAYSADGDIDKAIDLCRENLASAISTSVNIVAKTVNGVSYENKTVETSAVVKGSELVEYWEDADGGIWVLMRVQR